MLKIFNDLSETVELILSHFDKFLPVLNDLDDNQFSIDAPQIPITFIPLDIKNTITVNRERYIYAIAGNFLTGYVKQQWIRRSPIYVYPVYYNGYYVHEFYLTKKEIQARAKEIIEDYQEL